MIQEPNYEELTSQELEDFRNAAQSRIEELKGYMAKAKVILERRQTLDQLKQEEEELTVRLKEVKLRSERLGVDNG